jgi:hypothetical protein
VPCLITRRPDHHNHPTAEIADSLIALLSIVEPSIRDIDVAPSKTSTASTKSMPRFLKVASRFTGSKVIFDVNICTPINSGQAIPEFQYSVFPQW